MNYLKALWSRLITREKLLWKSATVWLSAVIAALPDLLSYVQSNFPTIAEYVPKALQDPVMRFIGLAVFLARMRSMVKIPGALVLLVLLCGPAHVSAAPPTEVAVEKNAPHVEGHPVTSVVVTQCNLIVAVYMTMSDGRLLRFDKSSQVSADQLLAMAYTATRSERVEVSCAGEGIVGYEKKNPI